MAAKLTERKKVKAADDYGKVGWRGRALVKGEEEGKRARKISGAL